MIDERAAAARLIEGSNVKKNPLAPIVDHPWRVLGATLLVTMGLGYFMQFVAPSITFKDMLGPDYPGLADYEYVQSEYTKDDNALVMIEAQDASTLHHRIPTGSCEASWWLSATAIIRFRNPKRSRNTTICIVSGMLLALFNPSPEETTVSMRLPPVVVRSHRT